MSVCTCICPDDLLTPVAPKIPLCHTSKPNLTRLKKNNKPVPWGKRTLRFCLLLAIADEKGKPGQRWVQPKMLSPTVLDNEPQTPGSAWSLCLGCPTMCSSLGPQRTTWRSVLNPGTPHKPCVVRTAGRRERRSVKSSESAVLEAVC